MTDLHALLEPVARIATDAGAAILEIYNRGDVDVDRKDDDSPITAADRAAHELIVARLEELTPEIPVFSEESGGIDYADRKDWPRFWLVDPLDGTKEFIKRNGEFTVNIALVEGDRPVLGVVQVPVLDVCYLGGEGLGDLGIRYGYQRFMPDVMAVVVIILIVLVQLAQSIGERIAAAVDKRATKSGGQ